MPVIDALPETVKLSSTATVPPAESKVRLPEEVSISLSPVIPTLMLPAVVPANVGLSLVPTPSVVLCAAASASSNIKDYVL